MHRGGVRPVITLPAEKGTYILIMRLEQAHALTIGRLGAFELAAGNYAYVGSAFGSGGLAGRLRHHLSTAARPHWHIDYLRQIAPVQELWLIASDTRYECLWADTLKSMPGAAIPIPRFGASDCRCETHLIYFETCPSVDVFKQCAGMGMVVESYPIRKARSEIGT